MARYLEVLRDEWTKIDVLGWRARDATEPARPCRRRADEGGEQTQAHGLGGDGDVRARRRPIADTGLITAVIRDLFATVSGVRSAAAFDAFVSATWTVIDSEDR